VAEHCKVECRRAGIWSYLRFSERRHIARRDRAQSDRKVEPSADTQRVFDALTTLSACVLGLEAKRCRLADRLAELARSESSAARRRAVLHERDELAREVEALHQVIQALREEVLVEAESGP